MPTIGNNANTLLHGLSDFWQRFYADYGELEAMYHGSEILLAQAYLDFLNSFLNVSIVSTPLFNTEYFKLILAREDKIVFNEAVDPFLNRYVLDMPDTLVKVAILQNKVIDPTASMEEQAGYDLDISNYQIRFEMDPSGRAGRVLGSTVAGSLLTYGTGALTQFYVTGQYDHPFTQAKVGHWLTLTGSGSGNDLTYRIADVLDDQTVLLQGTFTLPDINNGALQASLIDSEFTPLEGFGHRTVNVIVGGSFDDAALRGTTEIGSWQAPTPVGLGVEKGDIVRILDREAVPTVPTDLRVVLVRHDKLYVSSSTPVPRNATGADYVILRTPVDGSIDPEYLLFTETALTPVKTQTNGSLTAHVDGVRLSVPGASPVKFATTDKQRFVTLSGCGAITWPAQISAQGAITVQSGALTTPFARAVAGGTVSLTGSALGQDGIYTIQTVIDATEARVFGSFIAETGLTATLTGVTNDGVYRIKKVLTTEEVILDLPATVEDLNNGALVWRVHDGFRTSFTHTRIVDGSVELRASAGDAVSGGPRTVIEGTDYTVDYQLGELTQIGRFAGQWGVSASSLISSAYRWLREVVVPTATGSLVATDTEVLVSEIAFWAPDSRVDRYHLYNNYGYLINRFEASSETYREFIRGVFQLYILGPTMKRLESAFTIIAGFPVVRDDGEVFQSFDDTSDPLYDLVVTQRADGELVTYQFAKPSVGSLVRADIRTHVPADPELTFEAFEPLTEAFTVVDYVDDPTWWENIVIPIELMPSESAKRRRTLPFLYENVIGAQDEPHIGDPGLFIGADDEGVVPAYGGAAPAKRRKMANVVMNLFLKPHIFYIYYNTLIYSVLDPDFITDLRELILIAKPSWTYIYLEPSSAFSEQLTLAEQTLSLTIV